MADKESQEQTRVPCRISTLNGRQYTVEVQTDWSIWKLKHHMRLTYQIPEYEQRYVRGSVQLRSADLVCSLPSEDLGDSLELDLLRLTKPDCFSRMQAEDLWQAFLVFSQDDGDTVKGDCAAQIAKFVGKFGLADQIRAIVDIPKCFSFVDLLWYFSGFEMDPRENICREGAEIGVDVMDFGRFRCARMKRDTLVVEPG
eukprot:TRINITY_DN26438_c0_g1_i1.p1 TRINITY_DN26438_c0_g1~~TRINITY_DN26438_c0_g1_i1.p1  ORF type:complete len:215 (+),score=28.03 TRINITY_DN26438_c0_g1_i1:51-647(+)